MKFYSMKKLTSALALLLILVFAATAVYAQAGRGIGRLKGLVIDEDGKYVVDAEVEIIWHKDKSVKHKGRTDKKGRFVFMSLGSGNWQIFITAEGFLQAESMAPVMQLTNNPMVRIVMKKPGKTMEETMREKLEESSTLVDKANLLFAEAKYDEALQLYEKFLQKQPRFYQTLLFIGNCYKEKGEFDQAMTAYKKALEQTVDSKDDKDKELRAKVQSSIGDIYIRKNDLETAQKYFKESLELYPKDEILAYNVGEIFFSNNKTEEAIHYFKLSASIKPSWGEPHLKLGYTYLNSADYKSAIASFNKFIELSPQSPQAAEIKELIKSLKEM